MNWRRHCPTPYCVYGVFTPAAECPTCLIPTVPMPLPDPQLPALTRPAPAPRPPLALGSDA
jgi:hypothetical protein